MAEFSRFLTFRELDNQPSPGTENRSVGGSIPPLGTILIFSTASLSPPTLRYCPSNLLIILGISDIQACLRIVLDTMPPSRYPPPTAGIPVGIVHPCWYRASE